MLSIYIHAIQKVDGTNRLHATAKLLFASSFERNRFACPKEEMAKVKCNQCFNKWLEVAYP